MCTLVIHKLVRNGFFMLKLAPQLPQRCWRRCYRGVCNHYCVRECVRERFIFSALFCQLKEIRARKTRRPIGCSSGARSGANCSATEARGVLLQRGPANFMGHAESAICEPRRIQPDAVSYVCQQFTPGPTQVQISCFIGCVHASVNFISAQMVHFELNQFRNFLTQLYMNPYNYLRIFKKCILRILMTFCFGINHLTMRRTNKILP